MGATSENDDHILRASVLDAALELGVNNQVIANLLFEPDAESQLGISAGTLKSSLPSELQDQSYHSQYTPATSHPWPSSSQEPRQLQHFPLDSSSDSSHTSHSHYYNYPSSSSHELHSSSAHGLYSPHSAKPWMYRHDSGTPFSSYASTTRLTDTHDLTDDPFHSTLTKAAVAPSHLLATSNTPKKRHQGKLRKQRPSTRDGDDSRTTGYLSEGHPKPNEYHLHDADFQSLGFGVTRQRTQSESQTIPKPPTFLSSPSADSPYFFSSKMPARFPVLSAKSIPPVSSPSLYTMSGSSPRYEINYPLSSRPSTAPDPQVPSHSAETAKKMPQGNERPKVFKWGFKRSKSQPDLASSASSSGKTTPRAKMPPLPAPLKHGFATPPQISPQPAGFDECDASVEASSQSHETDNSNHSELLKAWQASRQGLFSDRERGFGAEGSLRSFDSNASDATLKPVPRRFVLVQTAERTPSLRGLGSNALPSQQLPTETESDRECHPPPSHTSSISEFNSDATLAESTNPPATGNLQREGFYSRSSSQNVSPSDDIEYTKSYSQAPMASNEPQVIASFGPTKSSSHLKAAISPSPVNRSRSQSLGRHQRSGRAVTPVTPESPWEISGSKDFALPSVLTSTSLVSRDIAHSPSSASNLANQHSDNHVPTLGSGVYRSVSTRRRTPEALNLSALLPSMSSAPEKPLARRPSEPAPGPVIPLQNTNRPKSFTDSISSTSTPDGNIQAFLQRPPAIRDAYAIPPPSPPPSAPLPAPPLARSTVPTKASHTVIKAPFLGRSRSDSPLNSPKAHSGNEGYYLLGSQSTYLTPPKSPASPSNASEARNHSSHLRTAEALRDNRQLTKDLSKVSKYRDLAMALGHSPDLSVNSESPSSLSGVRHALEPDTFTDTIDRGLIKEVTSDRPRSIIHSSHLSSDSFVGAAIHDFSSMEYSSSTLNAPILRGVTVEGETTMPLPTLSRGNGFPLHNDNVKHSKGELHLATEITDNDQLFLGERTPIRTTKATGHNEGPLLYSFLDLDLAKRSDSHDYILSSHPHEHHSSRQPPFAISTQIVHSAVKLPRTPPTTIPSEPPRSAMAAGDVFPRDTNMRRTPSTQGWL